jgi:hypothetical protein
VATKSLEFPELAFYVSQPLFEQRFLSLEQDATVLSAVKVSFPSSSARCTDLGGSKIGSSAVRGPQREDGYHAERRSSRLGLPVAAAHRLAGWPHALSALLLRRLLRTVPSATLAWR